MALTLNNFVGFETGGLEEAVRVGSTPNILRTIVRTGAYALEGGSGTEYYIAPFESVSDAGDDQIVGFAWRISDVTPAAATSIFRAVEDDNNALHTFQLTLQTDGDIQVSYASGGSDTFTPSLVADQWHYFEIKWQHLDSGTLDLFVDGSAAASQFTAKDMSRGGTFDRYIMAGATTLPNWDDVYCMSGSTGGTSDFLGPRTEVLGAYQNTVEDATDQGSALNNGTWADVGELIFDDGTQADYQQNGAIEGFTICDEGNRAGPAGDAPGTITGAKYIQRMGRTNGSSPTTLDKSFGNNSDGVTAVDLASVLNVAFANFFEVSEAAGVVPTNSENFAFGMGQTGAGGRDVLAHEMMACILHTQPALSTTLADMNFPDQNYYLGPFGT